MKREKMIQMAFKVPESLHRAVRAWANKRGMKLQFVATQALEEKIGKRVV